MIDIKYDSAAVEKDGTITVYAKVFDGETLLKNLCVQGKDKEDLKAKLRANLDVLVAAEKSAEQQKTVARTAVEEVSTELSASVREG
jgi:hypothetical protein